MRSAVYRDTLRARTCTHHISLMSALQKENQTEILYGVIKKHFTQAVHLTRRIFTTEVFTSFIKEPIVNSLFKKGCTMQPFINHTTITGMSLYVCVWEWMHACMDVCMYVCLCVCLLVRIRCVNHNNSRSIATASSQSVESAVWAYNPIHKRCTRPFAKNESFYSAAA